MAYHGKKYHNAVEKFGARQVLSIKDTFEKVKQLAFAKFDESVDVDINLGINATKSDQNVRGSVLLPHGTGKRSRVVVFAKGKYAEDATKAGADIVGAEDLIAKVQGGWMDFDHAVATPDIMGAVGQLAKILGPRKLLPNKKDGTVTFDVGTVVANLKGGLAFFKNDKQGIIHFSIGKASFDTEKLRENLTSLIKSIVAARPPRVKGMYLKKITVSSTMGLGVSVATDEFVRSV